MPNEPSLSELSNMPNDPELGTGTPAVVYNNKDYYNQLHQTAEFHAKNDMMKYQLLLQNKKDLYKRGEDIAKAEVDPNDKEALQQKLTDIFDKIAENPKALFGGADTDGIQAQLNSVTTDAVKSKQKYDFNKSMTNHIITSPSFNTDENRALIKQSEDTPLDEWQPYTLQADPTLDIKGYLGNVIGSDKDPNNLAYSKTSQNKFTPNQEFYYPETTEQFKIEPVLKRVDASLLVPKVKRAFESYYKGLSPEEKAKYEADGGGGLNKFARDWTLANLGTDKDITRVSQGRQYPNPFALENKRAATKAGELKLKYKFDTQLAKNKGDMVLDAIKLRALYKNGGKVVKGADGKDKIIPKNEFFDDMFDIVLGDAQKPENAVYETDPDTGQTKLMGYKINTTDKTKLSFGKPKKSKDDSDVPADDVILSPDGKSIISIYGAEYVPNSRVYKPKEKESISKTQMTVNEGKALMYKNYGAMKDIGEITQGDDETKEDTPDNEQSESNPIPATLPSSETIQVFGKDGTPIMIPKSQLQKALSKGYKQK